MFKSSIYPELREARRARVQQKLMQIAFAAAVGYLAGLSTLVWMMSN